MPRVDGLQLLEEVQKRQLPADVIITTGFGTIDHAVQAMRLGAADFLTKPINLEHLRLVVQRSLTRAGLAGRSRGAAREAARAIQVSRHPEQEPADARCVRVDQPRRGDNQHGLDRSARRARARSWWHEPFTSHRRAAPPRSSRSTARPCRSRYWKASFSATRRERSPARSGSARAGSSWPTAARSFLDEVGEIPLAMQAKLLRVLQERRFERVGGTQTIEVDVRVVAATNRDLLRLAKEGKFREDLYYRLNVVKIDLPPLHERPKTLPSSPSTLSRNSAGRGSRPRRSRPRRWKR